MALWHVEQRGPALPGFSQPVLGWDEEGVVGAPTQHSTGCIHVGVLQGRALVHDVGAALALTPGADVGSRAQGLDEIFLLIRHDHPVLQEGTQGASH